MAAYVTAAEFIARFDKRIVGDLASVDGVRVTEAALDSDERLTTALEDASGMLDAAVRIGDRYTASDLAGLTGNGLQFLKSIVCDIAFVLLIERRILNRVTGEEADRRDKRNREILTELRQGKLIFDVAATRSAGQPMTDGPTTAQANNLNTLTSRVRGHLYPNRMFPAGRG
jgi:phage gp36-like protein